MARVPLLRGAVNYEPRFCDHCGRQVIFGPVYVVEVEEVKYRVCSLDCGKVLKEAKHEDRDSSATHDGHSGSTTWRML